MSDSTEFPRATKPLFESADGRHWKAVLTTFLTEHIPSDAFMATGLPSIADEMSIRVNVALQSSEAVTDKERMQAGVNAARLFITTHFKLKNSEYTRQIARAFDLFDIAFKTDNENRLEDGLKVFAEVHSNPLRWSPNSL